MGGGGADGATGSCGLASVVPHPAQNDDPATACLPQFVQNGKVLMMSTLRGRPCAGWRPCGQELSDQ